MTMIESGWILMGLGLGGVFLSLFLFYLLIGVFVRLARRYGKAVPE